MKKTIQIAYDGFFEKMCGFASEAGFKYVSVNFHEIPLGKTADEWKLITEDIQEILHKNPDAKNFGILVGPEGGFSDEEADYAIQNGLKAIGLGRRILRTETVSGALIPVIMFDRNEI